MHSEACASSGSGGYSDTTQRVNTSGQMRRAWQRNAWRLTYVYASHPPLLILHSTASIMFCKQHPSCVPLAVCNKHEKASQISDQVLKDRGRKEKSIVVLGSDSKELNRWQSTCERLQETRLDINEGFWKWCNSGMHWRACYTDISIVVACIHGYYACARLKKIRQVVLSNFSDWVWCSWFLNG